MNIDRRQFLTRSLPAIAGIALVAEETTRRIFLPPMGGWFHRLERPELITPDVYIATAIGAELDRLSGNIRLVRVSGESDATLRERAFSLIRLPPQLAYMPGQIVGMVSAQERRS